mgnify:FL=1
MKMKNFLSNSVDSLFSVTSMTLLVLLFTLVNYSITIDRENVRLRSMFELSEMRSDINNDFVSELMWSRFNDFENFDADILVAQGRIEGVIDYINNDNSTYIDELWHEGYQRGLSQVDYERDVIAVSNFDRGYSKGRNEVLFVSDTGTQRVNSSPREVLSDAIKQPEFDKNTNLPENSGVVETLNKKIKTIENSDN